MANFLPTTAVPAHLAEHEDDEQACQRGYVKGTDFALPYCSQWSRLHETEVREGLLRHVNCGYLSTHGAPPTLLALKQHAQSLCLLIHALNPTLKSAEIGGGSSSSRKGKGVARDGDDDDDNFDINQATQYALNDAFDFLTDLTTPYTNYDPNHHKPLNALINEVRGRTEALGTTTYHCPLATAPPARAKGAPQRPYASHHNLIMHANACLERLDHEFSSTGGLLSLLPPPSTTAPTPPANPNPTAPFTPPFPNPDLLNARNTLLGQWLHFTQSLIARQHSLSQSYTSALDLLAGEAAIPAQHLSTLGPDGRAGGGGGGGGGLGGRAGGGHSGVAESRDSEGRPTVVAAVAAKFPVRASELEKMFTERVERGERAERENGRVKGEMEGVKWEVEVLREQNKGLVKLRDALMLGVADAGGVEVAERVHEQRERAGKAEGRVKELARERDEVLERERELRDEVEELQREIVKLRARHLQPQVPTAPRDCVLPLGRLLTFPNDPSPPPFPAHPALSFPCSPPRCCGPCYGSLCPVDLMPDHRALRSLIYSFRSPPHCFSARPAMPAPARADGRAAGAGPWPSYRVRPAAAIRPRPSPQRRQAASARALLGFAALGLAAGASATPTLPYTPTTILLPPDGTGDRTAYIFSPSDDAPDAVDFLSLDISTLKGSALEPTKLSSALTFLTASGGNCTTFAPAMLRNGTIAVVAGDCVVGATSTLWSYDPSKKSPAWTQVPLTAAATWDNAQSGPYHLGGLLTFSAELSPVLSEPTLYLYGGMCPSQSTSTASNWQSSATYSNRMLRLTPPALNSAPSSPYTLNYAPATGQQPPVAEAGFTLTELTPSLSNRSAIVTQQTTHVLLGGHTQNAFVNASTAALYSLPEETWAFVHIAAPAAPKADLARGVGAGAVASVDSRSGHSAVLSEDGTRLVVYGGWVGDVSIAAEPPLAVVKIGVGLGDWGWEVPEEQPSGEGVYGHGAVVLPGNVMMVYGGFGIGQGGLRRRGVEARFYNITSGTWAEEYVSPFREKGGDGDSGNGSGSGSGGSVHGGGGSGSSPGQTGEAASSEDDSSRKRKIGLGVGIGVGLLVIIAITALGACWFRRRRARRARRDETLRNLAQGVNGSLPRGIGEDGEMLEHEHSTGMFPWTAAAAREWYTGGDDPYQQGRRSLGYETLRGGARSAPSLYMPPPPSTSSFSSRPRGAKGLYQPTTGSSYDFTPLSGAPNRIDPIYEADEDEDGDLGRTCPLSPDREDRDDDDPFLTPTLHTPVGGLFPPPAASRSSGGSSTPPPPQPSTTGQEQHPDVQGWVSDVDASTHPLPRNPRTITTTQPPLSPTGGRTSPLRHAPSTSKSKSPRPSLVSTLTPDNSSSSSDANSARTGSNLSERSAAAFSFTQSTAGGTAAEDRLLLSRLRTTLATTTGGEACGGSSGSAGSGNSYNTARSSFAALQAEGPGLLQATRRRRNSDAGFSGAGAGEEGEEEEEGYVYIPGSPSKAKPPRRSWFGSLRRVFSGGTAESSREDVSGGGSAEGGGLLWHGESGVGGDYETGGGTGMQRRRMGWGEEEEEDLERAAERRTVQIMFTVPRETLRVVNAEVEREESVLIVDPEEDEESTSQGDSVQRQSGEGGQEAGLLTPTAPPTTAREDKGKAVDTTTRIASTLSPGGDITPGRTSPSPSARTSSFTTTNTTTLHTAEAVRLERPRTRVLAMVESFESRSREGSPSPERGPSPSRSM
ncbi:hypothetical protein C8A05DRAFT_11923 [Staphylotrichum tortipilum]|uniref:Uncharacterized protein n=1 Tax=Staphylotrichum tortipilum TaxID=2831512 RepID=A0AAN6MSJ2_9PEZI|nr:hypothetical protein C8A05DRAFT_11923 [Staphylotrichum longicolle]